MPFAPTPSPSPNLRSSPWLYALWELSGVAGNSRLTTTTFTFLGFVPQRLGYSYLVGKESGSNCATGFTDPYPINTNLNDLYLLYFGGRGVSSSANRANADKIVAPSDYEASPPTWTPILWLNTDGYWYKWSDDTKTTDTDTEINVVPGKGFYYQKADTEKRALVITKPY